VLAPFVLWILPTLFATNSLDCSVSSKKFSDFDSNKWNNWWTEVMAEGVRTVHRLNNCGDLPIEEASDAKLEPIDVPIFVMNRRDRPDRRSAVATLLHRVGFTNVSFPPTIMWHDIDVASLLSGGGIHKNLTNSYLEYSHVKPGYLPYIANALSQLETIERAVARELPLFGIFEDDLIQASSLGNTNCRIRRALNDLPPSADMLYLDLCHENCAKMSRCYHTRFLLKLSEPHCTGAIIYTLAGARRVLSLASPPWNFIDRMYPALIKDSKLSVRITSAETLQTHATICSINHGIRVVSYLTLCNGIIICKKKRVLFCTCTYSQEKTFQGKEVLLTPRLLHMIHRSVSTYLPHRSFMNDGKN